MHRQKNFANQYYCLPDGIRPDNNNSLKQSIYCPPHPTPLSRPYLHNRIRYHTKIWIVLGTLFSVKKWSLWIIALLDCPSASLLLITMMAGYPLSKVDRIPKKISLARGILLSSLTLLSTSQHSHGSAVFCYECISAASPKLSMKGGMQTA